ncbi:MAG: tRNA1(Val) (adenine(37)-N6)-methyltransferase [Desulfobacterales bacterium]
MNRYTADTFFNGKIKVRQDKSGYRFSIDAVLLADFVSVRPKNTVVDLGTGCGIIPLILAIRNPEAVFFGVEIQPALAELAEKNASDNFLEEKIKIIHKDMQSITIDMISGPVDRVVSNPPYRKVLSGRVNPCLQRAVARHEIKINLEELLKTAGRILRPAGKFFIIYPAERTIDLMAGMRETGIEPKRMRSVHSAQGTEARLILMEGLKGGQSGITIENPLIIYKNKEYTDEVEKMFSP